MQQGGIIFKQPHTDVTLSGHPGFLSPAERRFENKIVEMVAHLKAMRERLTDVRTFMQKLTQRVTQFRQGIQQGFAQAGDLAGTFGGTPFVDPTRIKAYFATQISQAKRFSTDLKALAKAKLSPALLAQIAGAGPAAAPLAEAILATGVGNVNQMQKQLSGIAKGTAASVTTTVYGREVDRTRKQLHDLNREIEKLTKALRTQTAPIGRGITFNINVAKADVSEKELRKEIEWWWKKEVKKH
jgi:prefoldin subunit 5